MLVVLGAIACGGDSDGGSDAGGTGGTTGGGTGGTTGGGTGGTSSTGTPDGGMTTGGTSAAAMCDTSITDMATCGSNTCPAASMFAACQVRCCLAGDVCGFRDSTMGMTTDCVAPPEEDPDCPDYNGGFATLPGCCYDGDTCGFISGTMNACIITHPLFSDLATMAGAACDGSDNDGGM
jgi:hypothetical protein